MVSDMTHLLIQFRFFDNPISATALIAHLAFVGEWGARRRLQGAVPSQGVSIGFDASVYEAFALAAAAFVLST